MEWEQNIQPKPNESQENLELIEIPPIPEESYKRVAITRFLELILFPVLAIVIHLFIAETDSVAISVTLVSAFILLVVAYVVNDEYRKHNQKERFRIQFDLARKSRRVLDDAKAIQEKKLLLNSAREGDLLAITVQKVSQELRGINIEYEKIATRPILVNEANSSWAYEQKWRILNSICEILKQDTRKSTGARDYFKATLFRVASNDILELDCNYYAPGDFPKTDRIERRDCPHSTAFRCLDERTMQAISNIPEEIKKGADARWVEFYTGQAKHYGSMLSTPITIGERSAHTYRAIAILTIDTNRIDYFSELEEDKNFIAILLAPFRQQLSFIYMATTNIPPA